MKNCFHATHTHTHPRSTINNTISSYAVYSHHLLLLWFWITNATKLQLFAAEKEWHFLVGFYQPFLFHRSFHFRAHLHCAYILYLYHLWVWLVISLWMRHSTPIRHFNGIGKKSTECRPGLHLQTQVHEILKWQKERNRFRLKTIRKWNKANWKQSKCIEVELPRQVYMK